MLKHLLASSILTLPLLACVDPDDATEPDLELLDVEPPAVVRLDGPSASSLYGVVAHGTGWDHDWIEVCWDASAFGTDPQKEALMSEAREWVRQAVVHEWGRVSKLRFIEVWPSCASPISNPDIRIGHHEITGWSVHGTEARDIPSGPTMTINLLGPAASTCVDLGGGGPGGGDGGYIPACNGVLLGADPASRENWTEALALHLFGYAIGLRKEDVHPDATPCPGVSESLDSGSSDGEPLWAYDATSVMASCRLQDLAYGTARPTLSAGDVRSINTLYPGTVRVFEHADFGGDSQAFGPGYYTRATTSAPFLAQVSGIVVPPGFRARVCNTSTCTTYTASKRALPVAYDDAIQNLEITQVATVADGRGFLGAAQALTRGTYKASQGQLAVVGNNAISSAWAAPGHAITLCDSETPHPLSCMSFVGGAFGTPGLVKLPGPLGNQFAALNMDNVASYVKVSPRVVTYSSSDFRDSSYSLAEGVYTYSGGATYVKTVRALLVPAGLEAVVCNGENPLAVPRPTCQTLTQSGVVSSALWNNVKRLEVRVPLVNAP